MTGNQEKDLSAKENIATKTCVEETWLYTQSATHRRRENCLEKTKDNTEQAILNTFVKEGSL